MTRHRFTSFFAVGALAITLAACADEPVPPRGRDTETSAAATTGPGSSTPDTTTPGTSTPDTTTPGTSSGTDLEAQTDALESYLDLERSQLDNLSGEMVDLFSEISVEGTITETGALAVYSYTYATAVDGPVLAEYFDSEVDNLNSLSETSVFPGMRMYGVENALYAQYTYKNADGSEIWSHTFMEDAGGATCHFTATLNLPATCADAP